MSARIPLTADHVLAAETVFKAMATVELVRPIVDNYRRRVLRELGWGHFDPKHSYQLPDSVFAEYDRRCKLERDAAGLHVENPDYCPLLVAENLLRQAHRVLIETMEPITQINADRLLCLGLDEYHKYVELTLRLLAPYVKARM